MSFIYSDYDYIKEKAWRKWNVHIGQHHRARIYRKYLNSCDAYCPLLSKNNPAADSFLERLNADFNRQPRSPSTDAPQNAQKLKCEALFILASMTCVV